MDIDDGTKLGRLQRSSNEVQGPWFYRDKTQAATCGLPIGASMKDDEDYPATYLVYVLFVLFVIVGTAVSSIFLFVGTS